MKNVNSLVVGNNTKIASLLDEHYNVFLFCNISNNNEKNRLSEEINNFNIIENKTPASNNIFKKIREIKRIVSQNNIEIVFSNRKDDMILVFLATVFNKKIKRFCLFHNSYAWLDKKKAKLLTKMINICCTGNICLSQLSYQFVAKKDIKKSLYLPNVIKVDDYNFKTNYDFNNGEINFCYTGVVDKHKNQKFIVNSVNELCKINDKFVYNVYFIGDILNVEYKKEIENSKKCNNVNVYFLSRKPLEFIKNNLCSFDIYFAASNLEMSPYNILEAQACGMPIIVSDVNGHNELVKNDFNGILFEKNNLQKCVKQLTLLISDKNLRSRLGVCARNYLKDNRSFKQEADQLYNFIENL